MPFDAMITNATKGVTKFWTDAVNRYTAAKALGNAYNANNLAADLFNTWSNGLDAWAGFFEFGSTPLVPTVFFSEQAANFVNQKPKRSAALNVAVPAAPAPQWTKLSGPAGTIDIPELEVTAADFEVDVTLKIVNLPAVGVYQGLGFLPQPLSRALVQIVVVAL